MAQAPAHPLLGHGSLHASTVSGGDGWSIYPAEARLRFERRTLPGTADSELEGELEWLMEETGFSRGKEIRTAELVFLRPPHEVSEDEAVVRALVQAEPDPEICGLSFWTDAALLAEAGVPTVIYGPVGAGAHADVEWVSLESCCRVYAALRRMIRAGLS